MLQGPRLRPHGKRYYLISHSFMRDAIIIATGDLRDTKSLEFSGYACLIQPATLDISRNIFEKNLALN